MNILTLHNKLAKSVVANVRRGLQGRYVWEPQARRILEQIETDGDVDEARALLNIEKGDHS